MDARFNKSFVLIQVGEEVDPDANRTRTKAACLPSVSRNRLQLCVVGVHILPWRIHGAARSALDFQRDFRRSAADLPAHTHYGG